MTEQKEKIINAVVKTLVISEDESGQRIDNYLLAKLKGVPKSLIYRIVRKGEVRVNKGRIKPEYKLQTGDVVRVPPVRVAQQNDTPISKNLNKVAALENQILFEDDCLIVLNKPSGIAVHGGSGLNFGVIEALRALRPLGPPGPLPLSHGYFATASRLARVRLTPTGLPAASRVLGSSRVRIRKVWALPSKPPIWRATTSSAFSPLCP